MTFLKNIGLVLAVFACASLYSFQPSAQDRDKRNSPIGHIAAVEGNAFVIGKGDPLRLRNDDPVYLNNTIETRDETRIIIVFIDDSQIKLGSNASLTIDEYVYDPYPEASTDPKPNKAKYSVLRGALQYISGYLAKPFDSDVKVKTGKGSIGIRGTNFWAGPLNNSSFGVYVFEGAVEFQSSQEGSGKRDVFLESGKGLYIQDSSETVPPSEKWQDFRIEKALRKVEFKNRSREQLLKQIRVHQERNIKSRQNLWRALHPRQPTPWGPIREDERFSDDMNEQQMRHDQRMRKHDDRIRQR